jgi:hypothetical protein
MSDEDDPFEGFEAAVDDREGDPFESLDAPEGESSDTDGDDEAVWAPGREEQLGGEPTATASDDRTEPTPGGEPAPTEPDAGGVETTVPPGESDGEPFGEVERDESDPFESAERAFEEMNVDDLDVDDVWETQGRTYAEVSKHSFCEGCEYFSAPPDVACGHDGTEILEFVDLETVRVVDCPVVAERRELEERQ